MRLPSNNPVTLLYGATSSPYSPSNPHNGIDIGYSPDDSIYAPEAGRITLEHDTGSNADGNAIHLWQGNRHHALCHMSEFADGITEGLQVEMGQFLGKMGSTGFAQGRHVHWCIKVNNKDFIDPLTLLTGGKGAEEMALQEGQINDNDDIAELWRLAFFRDPSPKEIADNQGLIGKYWNDASKALRTTDAFIGVRQQYLNGANQQPEYEQVIGPLYRKKS